MNELSKYIARAGRHKALLFLVLLLALAAVADRFYLQDEPTACGSSHVLAAGLPSTDEDAGNRAGTSVPADGDTAAQLVQFVFQKDNGPCRAKLRSRTSSRSTVRSLTDSQIGALSTTAPMIDTKLGRQFTLVGARPSGTS